MRTRSFGRIDCRDVALRHIGLDAILGRREMYQVPLYVTLPPESHVNEGGPPRCVRRQRRKCCLQALSFGCKPVPPRLRDIYEFLALNGRKRARHSRALRVIHDLQGADGRVSMCSSRPAIRVSQSFFPSRCVSLATGTRRVR